MKKAKGKEIAGHSKALCDCPTCECKKCPDVVKLLSVSIKDSKHSKDQKRKNSGKKSKKTSANESKHSINPPSLLGILKDKSDCNCEVVAKAVQSNVHMNLGLRDKRDPTSDKLGETNKNGA